MNTWNSWSGKYRRLYEVQAGHPPHTPATDLQTVYVVSDTVEGAIALFRASHGAQRGVELASIQFLGFVAIDGQ